MNKINLGDYLNDNLSLEEEQEKKSTGQHTLYVDEKDGHKHYTFFLEDILLEESKIHDIIYTLLSANGDDTLEVRIMSGGGSLEHGIRFLNMFENTFKDRVETILDTSGRSMGAMLFCAGDKRVVYKYSELMFHHYSTFLFGKGGELEDRQEHNNEKIKQFFEEYTLNKGFMTQEEVSRLYDGKDYWFDSQEMLERGIATHIIVDGKTFSKEEYLG